MNVTESEINRFFRFFDPERYGDVTKFMLSDKLVLIRLDINRRYEEGMPGSYITMIEAGDLIFPGVYDMSVSTSTHLMINPKSSWLEDDEISFLTSFLSRYFENFKLIFSSLSSYVFVATTDNMSAVACEGNPGNYHRILNAAVFYKNTLLTALNLSELDAEVSDEMWKIILDCRNNINYMYFAYVSHKYGFSDKIEKRIHDMYESLSDSDKLLLELGETLGDEEEN